ncbi:MAG: ABC transporter ATP-binding protein [Actinomycetota bacterium]
MPNDPGDHPTVGPVLAARDVSVVRGGRAVLDRVDFVVSPGQRWAVLGPNGCGKTTLLKVLSLYLHPSAGTVSVLGRDLGTFDVRAVRPRIAYSSASLASELRPALTAEETVMTARHGALEPWWHEYGEDDRERARDCLAAMGVGAFAGAPIGALSSGELQRVLLARALMNDPFVVLLDEPSARLDLGGREALVRVLDGFAADNPLLPVVTVTHHVDEIPASTTHCMMLRGGTVLGAGPLEQVLDSARLSECFGTDLTVDRRPDGRFSAWSR